MNIILKKEVLVPFFTLVICFLLCLISKKILYKLFNFKITGINDGKKKTILNLISNIIVFIIALIGCLIILETYGVDTASLVTSFGIVGLVAGLALQDILKDFVVGVSIIFEGQYSIGDWVTINGFKGIVMPSNLRTTKIKAYTGEVKIISNRNITEIINHSVENANLVVDIDVAYESDIKKVKEILDKLCVDIKQKYNLKEISCIGIDELTNNSIRFKIVANIDYSRQFELGREIKKELIIRFNKNKITIPYNQVVIHNG